MDSITKPFSEIPTVVAPITFVEHCGLSQLSMLMTLSRFNSKLIVLIIILYYNDIIIIYYNNIIVFNSKYEIKVNVKDPLPLAKEQVL